MPRRRRTGCITWAPAPRGRSPPGARCSKGASRSSAGANRPRAATSCRSRPAPARASRTGAWSRTCTMRRASTSPPRPPTSSPGWRRTMSTDTSIEVGWPRNDYSRVPFRLHHDEEIYAFEMERIFRGPAWSYLCLEAEIPRAGDFRATWVGDTPVVVSRHKDGTLHAFVNRCSHRGAMIVRELSGNAERHVCLYHRWCYSGAGELTGLPFRRGLKGEGGMPDEFDMKAESPRKLKVENFAGMLFGTFQPERAEP